jgi:hypothetical protein
MGRSRCEEMPTDLTRPDDKQLLFAFGCTAATAAISAGEEEEEEEEACGWLQAASGGRLLVLAPASPAEVELARSTRTALVPLGAFVLPAPAAVEVEVEAAGALSCLSVSSGSCLGLRLSSSERDSLDLPHDLASSSLMCSSCTPSITA